MAVRISLCSFALVLLGAWLAVSMVTPQAPVRFILEVPATTVSVGQQVRPRVVNLGDEPAAIQVRWSDGARTLASQEVRLDGGEELDLPAVAAPRLGFYRLQAEQIDAPHPARTLQSLRVQAVSEPPPQYGGVLEVIAAGLDSGVSDYLRAHGFAVSPLPDDAQALPAAALIVVGDARLGGGPLADRYGQIWSSVANGANLLLLQPPPPGVAPYWPLTFVPAPAAAAPDIFPAVAAKTPALDAGVNLPAALMTLLRPELAYAGAGNGMPDLYAPEGTRSLAADAPAIFCFRYGAGWVTVSTAPILGHFADTDARWYLMNLLKAAAARQPHVPPAPGIEWALERRLRIMSAPADPGSDLAAYFQPPPAPLEPPLQLAPALSDGDNATCVTEPQRIGMAVVADVAGTSAPRGWTVTAERWPVSFVAEASLDGVHWQPLPSPPLGAATAHWDLPASPYRWHDFRLRITADAPHQPWSVCEMRPN